MKWLMFALCISTFPAPTYAQSSEEALMFPYLYRLWHDSGFGRDPNGTEQAAWVIHAPTSAFEYMRWRRSFARGKESWKGGLPPNAVAQVHTHPVFDDPKPSLVDISLSRKINVPIYTVSARGIWKAMPNGRVIKVAGADWCNRATLASKIAIPKIEDKKTGTFLFP